MKPTKGTRMSEMKNECKELSSVTGSVGNCTECDDRWHHTWQKADGVCVDIYKNGEIVVLVKIGDRTEVLECNPQNGK